MAEEINGEIDMLDFWGNEIPEKDVNTNKLSRYQYFKAINDYRKTEDKECCCKVCKWIVKKMGHNRNYYKCLKIGYSSSPATDIRVSSVCNAFDRKES